MNKKNQFPDSLEADYQRAIADNDAYWEEQDRLSEPELPEEPKKKRPLWFKITRFFVVGWWSFICAVMISSSITKLINSDLTFFERISGLDGVFMSIVILWLNYWAFKSDDKYYEK